MWPLLPLKNAAGLLSSPSEAAEPDPGHPGAPADRAPVRASEYSWGLYTSANILVSCSNTALVSCSLNMPHHDMTLIPERSLG